MSAAAEPAGRDFAMRLIRLAARDPRRAGRMAASIDGSGCTAVERFALGWALLRWERLDAAVAHLEAAAGLAGPDEPLGTACRYGLLVARQLRGEGLTLQADWEAHSAACVAAGMLDEAARARCEQVAHLYLLGRGREARALAEAVAPLVEAHGGPAERLRLAHVAGAAAVLGGDFTRAEPLLWRAAEGFAALGRPLDAARARFDLAWLWQRREQFTPAVAELERALAVFRRLDMPYRVALCQSDLGLVARYRGDYDQAIALTLAARQQLTALGRDRQVATCDLNLGAVAHVCGLHDLALLAYQRAQLMYERAGDPRLSLVCQRNQALALCRLDRAGEALALLDAAEPAAAALGDRLGSAEMLVARAQALRTLGDGEAALAALEAAHTTFVALGSAAAAECLLDSGWIRLEQGRPGQALDYFERADAALVERPAHRWLARYGRGRVAEARGDPASALGHYVKAVELVAALRGRLASEHASSGVFALAQQLHADALRLAADLGRGAALLALIDRQQGLVLQRLLAASGEAPDGELRAAATAALRQALGAAAAPGDTQTAAAQYLVDLLHSRHARPLPPAPDPALDLAQLRQTLTGAYGDGWTVLAPCFLGEELLIAAVLPEQVVIDRLPLDGALRELLDRACHPRRRLQTYRDLERLRRPGLPAWGVLQALGERLLPAWLRERLRADHRLLLLPSGALHGLPWAALRLGEAWLCERAVVQLIPSLSRLARPAHLSAEPAALLIGCAEFGGRAAALPVARESLELVARRWPGPARRLVDAEATGRALAELSASGELQGYGLVHISSHAQLGAAGILAHIKLSEEDLLLDELIQLRLRGPLVVLATCEGGASEVLPGDELLGLSRGLLAAGAAAVISSLWPIYDRSVLGLLDPLYAELAAGADPALALARAQRALAARPADGSAAPLLSSPYVWGGFTLVADGASVTGGRGSGLAAL